MNTTPTRDEITGAHNRHTPAVLEVLVAREIADVGAPDYVRKDPLDEWRATDLDLAADSRRTTWPHRNHLDMVATAARDLLE
ncbi:MAG TPA: hypothetical protein VIX82_11185 [Solirubrobacteraceae bacterium]